MLRFGNSTSYRWISGHYKKKTCDLLPDSWISMQKYGLAAGNDLRRQGLASSRLGSLLDEERLALQREVRRLLWVSNFGVVLGQGQIKRALLRAGQQGLFKDGDGLGSVSSLLHTGGNPKKS